MRRCPQNRRVNISDLTERSRWKRASAVPLLPSLRAPLDMAAYTDNRRRVAECWTPSLAGVPRDRTPPWRHHRHERIAGEVDPAVEGVAAVFGLLFDEHQARVAQAPEDPPDRRRVEDASIEELARLELPRFRSASMPVDWASTITITSNSGYVRPRSFSIVLLVCGRSPAGRRC